MDDLADMPPWLQVAHREIGVKERPGFNNNPRILQYHATTRLHGTTDEIPWCASFVGFCLEQVGLTSTRSAAAASYRTYGQRCEPKPGAIVVFGKADRDAAGTGHVAFYVGDDGPDHILVLGGNQKNQVSIAKRLRSAIVSVRWPLVS
jgi:uncharacterized protein (TIGR02594 family)